MIRAMFVPCLACARSNAGRVSSGRVPAAFNNLVGLKPSRGVLSTSGVLPACRTLDCVSIFTTNCNDAHEALLAARGFDATDPYSRQPGPGDGAAPWLGTCVFDTNAVVVRACGLEPQRVHVGAVVAETCYVDHSPPVVAEAEPGMMRIRGEGRPGKRLRRELDRLRRSADA